MAAGAQYRTSSYSTSTKQNSATTHSLSIPHRSSAKPSQSFLNDLVTFKWMTNPNSSFKMISIVLIFYILFEIFPSNVHPNHLASLIFISYPFKPLEGEIGNRFDKGLLDLAFLGFYIVVFSWLRQVITQVIIKPLAIRMGIKKSKLNRFQEQAYAFLYFVCSSSLGLYVMSGQKTWFFRAEHYWDNLPHTRQEGPLKVYYLLQFAYWCQQMLVLIMRIEKPRSDIYELIIHHLVTIWLIGGSYMLNFTVSGVAIFISMDVPDVCLALSKCLNYLELKKSSEFSFIFFLGIWHYFRHYLNILWLYSAYYDLPSKIPETLLWKSPYPNYPNLVYFPFGMPSGKLPTWMMEAIFISILILQLVNIFWSYLIWKVLFKIFGSGLEDIREEGEDDEELSEDLEEGKKDI